MTKLPQEPGWYVWHKLDLHYVDIGLVQVLKDSKKHIDILRAALDKTGFLLYENDVGETLTMYYQGHDLNTEPFIERYRFVFNGFPCVDGYKKVNFDDIID